MIKSLLFCRRHRRRSVGPGRGSFAYSSGRGGRRDGSPAPMSSAHRTTPEERPPMSSQSRPSRSPARLDPWTLAALLSTPRPLPPRASLPPCASRSDQRPQFAGGQGLRSLPAVFAGARPALTLTAVDCFPGPFRSGAAVLTGDTPRPHRAGERGPIRTVAFVRFVRPRRRPFPLRGARRSRRGSSSAASAAGILHPDFAPPARQPLTSRHCVARLGSGRHPGRLKCFIVENDLS